MKTINLNNENISILSHEDDVKIREGYLDSVPGFQYTMSNIIAPVVEQITNIEYMGNGIQISDSMLSHLDKLMGEVCATLGVENKPRIVTDWYYGISTHTRGVKNPIITLYSGTVDLLDEKEIQFLLGHEIGHQLCGHLPYHAFLECLFLPVIKAVPGGSEWIKLIRTTLLKWYRISDFSADRIGLLACQDIDVAMRVLIKMSGIPHKHYESINIESFIKQAEEFDCLLSGMANSVIKYLSINDETRPWLVIRAAELYKWYKSGEYEKCINNNCVEIL